MPVWRLTARAEADIQAIFRHTFVQFCDSRATAYIQGMEKRFELLCERPELGRSIDRIRAGYRRYEYGRHVIFYRRAENDIEIVRVLHDRMNFRRRL